MILGQALKSGAQRRVLGARVRKDALVLGLVMAMEVEVELWPLLFQGFDAGDIAARDPLERIREVREVAPEAMVRRHQRGRDRGGAVRVEELRRMGMHPEPQIRSRTRLACPD